MRIIWLIFFILLISCQGDFKFDVRSNHLTIDSSLLNSSAINYQNVERFTVKGKCLAVEDGRLKIEDKYFYFSCTGTLWSVTIDASVFENGNLSVSTEYKKENIWTVSRSYKLNKNDVHPKQIAAMELSKITEYTNSAPIKLSDGSTVVIYSSDEFCAVPKCSVQNLVLRSSRDNFISPFYLTDNPGSTSHFPNVIEKDGLIHMTYLSNARESLIWDVMYATIDPSTMKLKSPRNLTPAITVSASLPFIRKAANGEIFISYTSKEYCSSNSCDVDKVTLRRSSDNFTNTIFIGTQIECGINGLRFYVHSASNTLHFSYGLTTNGSCTATSAGGGNVAHTSIDELGTLTNSRFFFAHGFVGATMVADATGKVYIFFTTTNGLLSCSGWKVGYVTSLNFNTKVHIPDTCKHLGSYPGISQSPIAEVDSNNVVHLYYITNDRADTDGFPVSYKSSADNFVGTTNIQQDYFGSFQHLNIYRDGDEQLLTYAKTTTRGGIYLYSSHDNSIKKMTPDVSERPQVHYHNDTLFGIMMTDDYCQTTGTCSRLNYVLENFTNGMKTELTKFTSDAIYALPPKVLNRAAENMILYTSNEDDVESLSISSRTSTDSFIARTSVVGVGSSLRNSLVDENDEVKLIYDFAKKGTFKETLGSAPVSMPPAESINIQMKYDANSSRTAFIYQGNESGWRPRVRSTADNLANYATISSKENGKGFEIYFDPSGILHSLAVFDIGNTGKLKLSVQSEADNFVSVSSLFDTSEGNVCTYNPHAKYDTNGILHVAYSLKRDGEDFCNIFYRNSQDWSVSHQLTFSKNRNSYPERLFVSSSNKAVICGGSNFNIICYSP